MPNITYFQASSTPELKSFYAELARASLLGRTRIYFVQRPDVLEDLVAQNGTDLGYYLKKRPFRGTGRGFWHMDGMEQ